MPEFIAGRGGRFWICGQDYSCIASGVTVSSTAEAAETSTLCNTYKTYIPGQVDGTISFEGYLAKELDHPVIQETGQFHYFPVNAEGETCYAGRVCDAGVEIGSDIGGAVSLSGEAQINLKPAYGKVLVPDGDHDDSTPPTKVDFGQPMNGFILLEGDAVGFSCDVEGSDDDATYVAAGTISADGERSEAMLDVDTPFRYLRLTITAGTLTGLAAANPYAS